MNAPAVPAPRGLSAEPVLPAIERVGVVGCGAMGAGIAEVCAAAGLDVRIVVPRQSSAAKGLRLITGSLDRSVAKGRLGEADRAAALRRITFSTELKSLADRQLVTEAIREDEAAKLALFTALDRTVEDPDAILASNTSSIPITKLARATRNSGRVIGIHFFNPVPALPLVELVESLVTDHKTKLRAREFVTQVLGKQTISSGDRAGFVVNALLIPFVLSAIRMVESGFASAESVDRAMVLGCSHPMGPLKLADLIGLDVVASIADALHAEFRDPSYARPPMLSRLVESGLLGRKTGSGFYTYDDTRRSG
ncbi:3-hydroxybutyryl-CoA dehydrogenase [Streptomyces sp. NPDC058457]|uniref:3-hydroxybutyryl-CoA dehydrogenase n=1 Tax=Streptomyces sp. NPDC058457 TaxID=3346507 RepID=UPI00364685AE